MTSSLSSRSSSALSDEILQGALKRATSLFIERRAEAITSVTDWEALRLRARAYALTMSSEVGVGIR